MDGTLQEWTQLLLRAAHVITAIMWIGDSFLFMWLDYSLRRPARPLEGDVIGELWMAHGGGFYEVVKRRSLAALPPELHFFKWESYSTWITGFLLLLLVYGAGGKAMLLEADASWSHGAALGLVLAVLFGAMGVYHLLCRTPLIRSAAAFGVVGLVAVLAGSWALGQVLAWRATWLLVGATLGTIMASNVFFIIIPAQREMLAATTEGRPVDTSYGARAKQRSTHNHFLTFPVLLTMLSNHVPGLYGAELPWLVLGLTCVIGVGVKAIMITRGSTPAPVWAGTAAALALAGWLTLPASAATAVERPVAFAEVQGIIVERCVGCHARTPTLAGFKAPPQGLVLETPAQIQASAARIVARTVQTRTMPLGNLTKMTDDERALLAAWVAQGAAIDAGR